MAQYKHLSIPPDEFTPVEELTRKFNDRNKTNLKPPKIVIMAVRRMLADMDSSDERT